MHKILIVEDDESILQLIEELLTLHNFTVYSVDNAKDALKMIPVIKPDLILTDVLMDNMTGLELLAKVRETEEWRDIPCIILSALQSKESIYKGMHLGADDYLIKPFKSEELINAIKIRLIRKNDVQFIHEHPMSTVQMAFGGMVTTKLEEKVNKILDCLSFSGKTDIRTSELIDHLNRAYILSNNVERNLRNILSLIIPGSLNIKSTRPRTVSLETCIDRAEKRLNLEFGEEIRIKRDLNKFTLPYHADHIYLIIFELCFFLLVNHKHLGILHMYMQRESAITTINISIHVKFETEQGKSIFENPSEKKDVFQSESLIGLKVVTLLVSAIHGELQFSGDEKISSITVKIPD